MDWVQAARVRHAEWQGIASAVFPSDPRAERGNEYERRNRLRSRAASRAMRRLKNLHPEQYQQLYREEKERLDRRSPTL